MQEKKHIFNLLYYKLNLKCAFNEEAFLWYKKRVLANSCGKELQWNLKKKLPLKKERELKRVEKGRKDGERRGERREGAFGPHSSQSWRAHLRQAPPRPRAPRQAPCLFLSLPFLFDFVTVVCFALFLCFVWFDFTCEGLYCGVIDNWVGAALLYLSDDWNFSEIRFAVGGGWFWRVRVSESFEIFVDYSKCRCFEFGNLLGDYLAVVFFRFPFNLRCRFLVFYILFVFDLSLMSLRCGIYAPLIYLFLMVFFFFFGYVV